jgi:hypothetical protein
MLTSSANMGSETGRASRVQTHLRTSLINRGLREFGVMAVLHTTRSATKGPQENFTPPPRIVHELEEAEIQRQLLLGRRPPPPASCT